MKIKTKLFVLLVSVTACASYPIKDFKTVQYLPFDGVCFDRLKEDGSREIKCYYDEGLEDEKNWTVIRKSDLYKEWDYQDKLIKSCEKWR